MIFDCPGCAERRKAMAQVTRRITDWMKRPSGAAPVDPLPLPQRVATEVQIDRLAKMKFLADNAGELFADWDRATEQVRAKYRQAILDSMSSIKS